jgi:hypothetical protein
MMIAALGLAIAVAQPTVRTPPSPSAVPARGEEAAVIKAVEEVYAVISGPAGQKRDWSRMKSLFTADARLYAVGARGLQGGSLNDYIAKAGPMLEKVGFTERELTRQLNVYGNLAQVWSSYAGTSTDGSVSVRGINSFQLARQPDGRWLVHSILWQAERPGLPLPRSMEGR